MAAGRYAQAQAPAERWLALAEAAGDPGDRIAALRAVGESFAARRMAQPAGERFERALALAGAAGDSRITAELCLRLADQRIHLAEFARAERLIERARALAKERGGFDARFEFELESGAGTLALHRREPGPALAHRRAALAAAERLGEDGARATALSNLGRALAEFHDHAAAIDVLQRALEIPDPRPDRRAIALGSLGISAFELGQFESAQRHFESALELLRPTASPTLEGWLEGELGLVAARTERSEEARAHYRRAIELARATGDRRNEAIWWQNLGVLLREEGRCAEALPIIEQALALRAAIGAPEPHLWKHLGQCQAALGHDELAEPQFERALRLAREQNESKALWQTERERARLYRRTHRHEEAERSFAAALDAIEATRASLALPSFKTDFFESKVEVYDELIDYLAGERGEPAEALAVAERARARAFLDTLAESRARVESALPEAALAAERRLADEVSRLGAIVRRDGATEERTAALGAAERALDAHRLRVRLEHPAYRALREPRPAPLAELTGALDERSALLVYWLGSGASHRWLVRRDGVDHRALAPRAEIESAARRAYAELSRPPASAGADPFPGADAPAALATLSALLFAGLGPGTLPPRLVVVPDGILHFVPFEPLAAGGGELGDRVRVAYLPAASLLADLPRTGAGRDRPPRLLAVGATNPGGATRDAVRSAALGELGRLGALPHAAAEARAAAARFGRRSATLLVDHDATEARLRALPLADFSVLHLAAHGWLDPLSAERSGLVLEPGGEADDGVLALREIVALRLDADLVTLSACRSGLGELVSGEGMVGVTRGFLHAGARAVVASLWAVDDEATAAFMARFYRALGDRLPVADALARARSELRAEARFRHPYYWAPWIVVGRGDLAVPFPPRRAGLAVAGAAAALAAAASIALAFRARRHGARGA
jgi:tetratricopeptide (TPR) repeat protein